MEIEDVEDEEMDAPRFETLMIEELTAEAFENTFKQQEEWKWIKL